nr:hypothetical protein BaRGS_029139 [Batillaria attramentaria]
MRPPDKDIETMKKLMKDLFKVKEEETEILLRMEPDIRIDDIDEGPVIVSESGFDPEALEIGGTGSAETKKSAEEFDYFPVKAREAFRAELAVAGIQLEEDGDQEDYETEGNEEEEETETAEEHSGAAQEEPEEEEEEPEEEEEELEGGEEEPEGGEEEPEEGEEEPEGGEEDPEEEDDFEAEGDGTGGRFDKERDTGQALRNNIRHYRLFRPGFHKTASDIGAGTAGTLADLIGTGGQQSGWFSFDMRAAGEAASALQILMRSGTTG